MAWWFTADIMFHVPCGLNKAWGAYMPYMGMNPSGPAIDRDKSRRLILWPARHAGWIRGRWGGGKGKIKWSSHWIVLLCRDMLAVYVKKKRYSILSAHLGCSSDHGCVATSLGVQSKLPHRVIICCSNACCTWSLVIYVVHAWCQSRQTEGLTHEANHRPTLVMLIVVSKSAAGWLHLYTAIDSHQLSVWPWDTFVLIWLYYLSFWCRTITKHWQSAPGVVPLLAYIYAENPSSHTL